MAESAMFVSVSERMLKRQRQEMDWPMGEQEFSDINCDIDDLAPMPESQWTNGKQCSGTTVSFNTFPHATGNADIIQSLFFTF